MKRPDETMFTLQYLISGLSKVERNHHILGSDRSENDVKHSYTVAMLCWYLYDKLNLKLDLSKVLKYALIHDFVEVYAGDVNTFASKADRQKKIETEAIALKKLVKDLEKFPDMANKLEAYENKTDEEAEFVWIVDKIQSLILGDLDDWRPYKKKNISYGSFVEKHNEHLKNSTLNCQQIFKELFDYSKTTYYDRPKS